MCNLTQKAFDIAFKYRLPVIVAADGDIGHGKENIVYPEPTKTIEATPWAVHGTNDTRNVITSIHLDPNEMEVANVELLNKYNRISQNEVMFEEYNTEGAELILVGYGSVSRTMKDVIDHFKGKHKIGMLRPITLWPFPSEALIKLASSHNVKMFLVGEQSDGQMYHDVQLAVMGRKPVHFFGRLGGTRLSSTNLMNEIGRLVE